MIQDGLTPWELTAKIVNDNRVDGIGKYSTSELKMAEETLSGMIDFMNRTGNHLVVVGLVMQQTSIRDVLFYRKAG
jgi:hypothetical protein